MKYCGRLDIQLGHILFGFRHFNLTLIFDKLEILGGHYFNFGTLISNGEVLRQSLLSLDILLGILHGQLQLRSQVVSLLVWHPHVAICDCQSLVWRLHDQI